MKILSCIFTILNLLIFAKMDAKVIDLHFSTPSEERSMDNYNDQKEVEKAYEMYDDPNSSYEEKVEALETLLDKGNMT